MVRKTTILLVLVAVASAMAQRYGRYRGPFDDDDYGYMGSVDQDEYGPGYGRYGPSDYRPRRGRGGSSDSDSDSSDSDSGSDERGGGFDLNGFLASVFGPRRPDGYPRPYGRPYYGRPSYGRFGPSSYEGYDRSNEDNQEISNHILTQ